MRTITDKGAAFAALHEAGTFLLPNAWDRGSARIMEAAGALAIGTTSAGFAFSRAQADMIPGRAETLGNAAEIVAAVEVPVSADLVDFFAEDDDGIAETARMASAAGLVGATIEDVVPGADHPIRPLEEAVARLRVAVKAARSLPHPFLITARAENFIHGIRDLDDTIRRLGAFAEAGADLVYAPGVVAPVDIQRIIDEVPAPVNVLAGIGGNMLSMSDYSKIGVRRISFGAALWGVAHGAVRHALGQLSETGSFEPFDRAISYPDASALFHPTEKDQTR